MNLPRDDELALQFGVGNERALEAFPLGRRHFALQVIEKFLRRHLVCDGQNGRQTKPAQ
jgi:hypothetical protein